MSQDNSQTVYRTTPGRTGKMMVIMLGICIVGGAIFFGMWDYWISQPAPVVAMMAGDIDIPDVAVHTGATITSDLSFIESSDFRTLAFNALPGDPGNNPTIKMEVGDKVVFNVVNDGMGAHAFGVTQESKGTRGIIPNSEIGSIQSSLTPGDKGTSEFIAGEEGIYYYICTVTGHRAQGMVGTIIVGDATVEEPAEPEPEVVEPEPEVMEEPKPVSLESDGVISMPVGSSAVQCTDTYECYVPYSVLVSVGDEVTWSNDDTAAHTVTSGMPGGETGEYFDSGILLPDQRFSVTIDEAGTYPYYCTVHPWMTGTITAN